MKYLYMLISIGLLYSPASAEIFWQAYITKNNDQATTTIAPGVNVSTDSVRLDLPGMPVKALVQPVRDGILNDGREFAARLLEVEFLDGTGAAVGAVCEKNKPGHGNAATLMLRRYNMLYQIDLQCLDIPEVPK